MEVGDINEGIEAALIISGLAQRVSDLSITSGSSCGSCPSDVDSGTCTAVGSDCDHAELGHSSSTVTVAQIGDNTRVDVLNACSPNTQINIATSGSSRVSITDIYLNVSTSSDEVTASTSISEVGLSNQQQKQKPLHYEGKEKGCLLQAIALIKTSEELQEEDKQPFNTKLEEMFQKFLAEPRRIAELNTVLARKISGVQMKYVEIGSIKFTFLVDSQEALDNLVESAEEGFLGEIVQNFVRDKHADLDDTKLTYEHYEMGQSVDGSLQVIMIFNISSCQHNPTTTTDLSKTKDEPKLSQASTSPSSHVQGLLMPPSPLPPHKMVTRCSNLSVESGYGSQPISRRTTDEIDLKSLKM